MAFDAQTVFSPWVAGVRRLAAGRMGHVRAHLPVHLTTLRPVPLVISVIGALLLGLRCSVLRVLAVRACLGLVARLSGLPVT